MDYAELMEVDLAKLGTAVTELRSLQQRARRVTTEAKENFSVTGRKDGTVAIADALICEVDGPGQKKRDLMQWYADTLAGIVSHAAEVDAAAVQALRASHGEDPTNAGRASYTSLDQDMLPRAVKLAGLGDDTKDEQRAELRRLWQSLSPESRAQLWTQHKEELLAAGVLTPSVKRVAVDDGAGPYNVDSPGFGAYWMEFQANGISNSGDFTGKTDAARHMDHYLNGTGIPVDLDVDRMLNDENDTVLRDASEAKRNGQEEK
ncbi:MULTISPECIES: hypothetical protein [unclassified Streptomyces]|uniref:hypothetical protein n=1 Tax=unclassified Streptomyces TaxID=2593676 RepID=UPI0006AE5661|nr:MULTISPECIES: hypothetical protein [unclassified Streptomyces]